MQAQGIYYHNSFVCRGILNKLNNFRRKKTLADYKTFWGKVISIHLFIAKVESLNALSESINS